MKGLQFMGTLVGLAKGPMECLHQGQSQLALTRAG